MASNFPSSLDSFTNPSSSDAMDSVSVPHATQHSDLNDAVEALQVKVGADSSAVTSSLDYKVAQLEASGTATAFTPSWSNLTPGNGTENFHYAITNDVMTVMGKIDFGSTTSVSGAIGMTLPASATMYDIRATMGGVYYLDDNGPDYEGVIRPLGTTLMRFYFYNVVGSGVQVSSADATNPFTWATGDSLRLGFTVLLS
jgi:hypothetical protein